MGLTKRHAYWRPLPPVFTPPALGFHRGPFRVSRATKPPETPLDQTPGEGEAGRKSGGSIISVMLRLSFVAAPGHPAPEPQSVEYGMDLSKSEGSKEVPVFLGEVAYASSEQSKT